MCRRRECAASERLRSLSWALFRGMCQSGYVTWRGYAKWSNYSFIKPLPARRKCAHIVEFLANKVTRLVKESWIWYSNVRKVCRKWRGVQMLAVPDSCSLENRRVRWGSKYSIDIKSCRSPALLKMSMKISPFLKDAFVNGNFGMPYGVLVVLCHNELQDYG